MAKSHTFATAFMPFTANAQTVADSTNYPAANAAAATRPRMLWRSTAAGHWIEADFGAGVSQRPAGFFLHNTNVLQWHAYLLASSGSGGDDLGTVNTQLCPRTGRARGYFTVPAGTTRRYLRLVPVTYHETPTYAQLGALACPSAVIELDDYLGEELAWATTEDIEIHRFPGGSFQDEVRGTRKLVTKIENDWLQSGSTIKTQS